MLFTLMNKDTPIADIIFEESTDPFTRDTMHKISQVTVRSQKLYDACVGKCSISRFLESRKAPKHRAHIQEMFSYLNFGDMTTFLEVTKGLSLIDTLWIRSPAEHLSWVNVSLFRNEFNDVIARYAFEGTGVFGQGVHARRLAC